MYHVILFVGGMPGGIELLVFGVLYLLMLAVPIVAVVLIVYYLRSMSHNLERLAEQGEE